jgi:hypothetical protein
MVVVDRAPVAAGDAEQRSVLERAVVHHHADGREVVVGVRVEGPVLVPLDRRPVARGLDVELGGVEADGGVDQLLQDREHVRVAHHPVVRLVLRVRGLDPADARLLRAVRRLEVVDLVVLAHEAGLLDELVGHPPELYTSSAESTSCTTRNPFSL